MTIERRASAASELAGDERELFGLVTPFDVWTTIGIRDYGGWDERIAAGAFTKTLRERDVVLLDAHDTSQPMARMSVASGEEGHLSLVPDLSAGLRAHALPVLTTRGLDVLKLAKAKVIRGMSFGFEVIKDSWTDDAGNPSDAMRGTKRTILEVRLHEVTTTAFPAYPTTELSARDAMNTSDLIAQRAAFQAAETRAAKATYSQVYSCGECDATSQYGLYCGECGASMEPPVDVSTAEGGYCTSCGSELDGSRRDHVCAERRDASTPGEPEAEEEPAGEATPDEDEAADLRALANHYLLTMGI